MKRKIYDKKRCNDDTLGSVALGLSITALALSLAALIIRIIISL